VTCRAAGPSVAAAAAAASDAVTTTVRMPREFLSRRASAGPGTLRAPTEPEGGGGGAREIRVRRLHPNQALRAPLALNLAVGPRVLLRLHLGRTSAAVRGVGATRAARCLRVRRRRKPKCGRTYTRRLSILGTKTEFKFGRETLLGIRDADCHTMPETGSYVTHGQGIAVFL
jgi:hypothetical protein